MQQPATPPAFYPAQSRRRGVATSTGLIVGIIAILIILGIGYATGFHNVTNSDPLSAVYDIGLLFAFFVTPFLAGLIGTLRSGRISSGTLAGLWAGALVGIGLGVYLFLLYQRNGSPTSSQSLQQAQQAASQQGLNISPQGLQALASPQVALTGVITAAVILFIVFLGLGAFLGVIGALIGKIFARRPRDYEANGPVVRAYTPNTGPEGERR